MTRPYVTASAYLSLAALLAALAGCGHKPAAKQDGGTAALQRVVAAKPVRKTLTLSTRQPGRIEAFEQTPLFAKIAGYVDNVLVDIGDAVRKNQTLVTLAIPELVDELEQKEALVAQAEAEVEQSKSAVEAAIAAAETAESRIAEAQAGIARTEAQHERWKSEHARIQDLAAKGSVTKKLVEETLNQLRSAEAANREAVAKAQSSRAAHYEAQANVGKARADRGAAEARLRVAKAELARAKTMLAYTEIKAPYDGMVTRREVDTGHYVHPAGADDTSPLLVVARTDKVRIFIEVPEMEAPYVDAGDPAQVKVQALPASQFDAAVVRTSWSLLEINRSLRAEVDVPNPHGLLRPGMYATVTIRLDERPDALTLPATAVVRDGNATYCMCIESGKIDKRPIELGLRSGSEVEVISGINEDSAVVLKEPEKLRPGQPVLVAPAAK
jgi:HlyD family secretion protein